jgi:predicted DNA binding CopG/RHH family protein
LRRTLGGKAFNTDTAVRIYESRSHGTQGATSRSVLYQAKHGAFFLFIQPPEDPADAYLQPISDDEAIEWSQKHAPHLVEQYFGQFPESGVGERRWSIRIPEALARRIEAIAQEKGIPINRYVKRCLERALMTDDPPR